MVIKGSLKSEKSQKCNTQSEACVCLCVCAILFVVVVALACWVDWEQYYVKPEYPLASPANGHGWGSIKSGDQFHWFAPHLPKRPQVVARYFLKVADVLHIHPNVCPFWKPTTVLLGPSYWQVQGLRHLEAVTAQCLWCCRQRRCCHRDFTETVPSIVACLFSPGSSCLGFGRQIQLTDTIQIQKFSPLQLLKTL